MRKLFIIIFIIISFETYGETLLPDFNCILYFTPNKGQLDKSIKFIFNGKNKKIYFTNSEIIYNFYYYKKNADSFKSSKTDIPIYSHKKYDNNKPKLFKQNFLVNSKSKQEKLGFYTIRQSFLGANKKVEIYGTDFKKGHTNYFIGKNKNKWTKFLKNYGKIYYKNIYKGIDLVYSIKNDKTVKYDFIVKNNGKVNDIKIQYKGANKIYIDKNNNLIILNGKLIERKPYAYQIINGKKKEILCNYIIKENNIVGFKVAQYNKNYDLVIDPKLVYSSYFNSIEKNIETSMAVDKNGNVYVVGSISPIHEFPITENAYNKTYNGGYYDVFLFKLSPDGKKLLYATYFGGSNSDYGTSVAIDDNLNVYITGYTWSEDLPTTTYQREKSGYYDAFLTKFSKDGDLIYSTYFGGTEDDIGEKIKIDKQGNCYLNGITKSPHFTGNKDVYNTELDLLDRWTPFFAKFSPDGNIVYYCFYHKYKSNFNPMTINNDGNIYTLIENYIYKFSTDGKELIYGKPYIKKPDDINTQLFPTAITVDSNDFIYLAGDSADNSFIMKLSPDASERLFFTLLGGSSYEQINDIFLDKNNNIYVTGITTSSNFPITNNAYDKDYDGKVDGFIAKFSSDGHQLLYSTFLGGEFYDEPRSIYIDKNKIAYVMGVTNSCLFPITPENAYRKEINDSLTVFISKFALNLPPEKPVPIFPSNRQTINNNNIEFSWECSDPDCDSLNYNLYIFDEDSSIIKKITELNEKKYSINSLKLEKTYYWKIVAKDGIDSTVSDTWSFKIKKSTVNINENQQNLREDLIKIYPNPLINSGIIKIKLKTKANVKITIFNTLGIKKEQWMIANISNSSINLKTDKLSSGIYYLICEIERNGKIKRITQKLTILK